MRRSFIFSGMTSAGSQQLQNILLGAAALFLLYEIWRGWQFGFVRGLLRLVALFCAWVGGSAAAGAMGSFLTLFSKVPPLLAPLVAGIVVGLGIYAVISLIAGLLFKRTDHHEGIVRFFFGLGGMLCGILYGLLILCGAITMIRGLGALGEVRVAQARAEGHAPGSERTALFLIQLRAALEMGSLGESLKDFDPLPTLFYDNITKVSKLYGNPQALQRFLHYPTTQQLLSNPKVLAFLQDPALAEAVQSHNYLTLIQNKPLFALLKDPQIMNELKSFDVTKALDFALTPPAIPSQSPVATPSTIPIRVTPGKYRRPVSPNSPLYHGHATNAPSPIPTAP